MSQKSIKNIAISTRQKLLNKARKDQRPFAELLQYYAMERFLYRLSQSKYKDKFVLKGALALLTWGAPTVRPTKDIDLLGKFDNDVEVTTQVISEICKQSVTPDDGLVFDIDAITGIKIKEDADYQGVRVRFLSFLDTAKVTMQIDIGFGDSVYPKPEINTYPTLLDLPAPKLLSYSKETTIAEKLEAMVKLGELNSRMKDFYDIWLLSRQFQFNGLDLQKAITGTFSQRGTELPSEIEAFTESFIKVKDVQWKAFRNNINSEAIPVSFEEVISQIRSFIQPIVESTISVDDYNKSWLPESGWS
jgi:predicted nucleotidyltransferase component of viral defense system